jgi:hypothetical protein
MFRFWQGASRYMTSGCDARPRRWPTVVVGWVRDTFRPEDAKRRVSTEDRAKAMALCCGSRSKGSSANKSTVVVVELTDIKACAAT